MAEKNTDDCVVLSPEEFSQLTTFQLEKSKNGQALHVVKDGKKVYLTLPSSDMPVKKESKPQDLCLNDTENLQTLRKIHDEIQTKMKNDYPGQNSTTYIPFLPRKIAKPTTDQSSVPKDQKELDTYCQEQNFSKLDYEEVKIVIRQAQCSYKSAVYSLHKHGNIVDAILELTP